MMHIDEHTAFAYLFNELDANDALEVKQHIEQCKLCSQKIRVLGILLAQQKQHEPSPKVLQNILHYYNEQRIKTKTSFFQYIQLLLQRYRVVFSFTVMMIIISAGFIFFNTNSRTISIPHILYVSTKSGQIHTSIISENKRITIHPDSSAILKNNNHITLQLAGGADLCIEKSTFDKNSLNKHFHYKLSQGSINVKSTVDHQSMNYSLETPHALLQPLGTEFYVNVSAEGTHIYIVEGNVIVTNTLTKEIKQTQVGTLYTISKTNITTFDIEKHALQWINDIDTQFDKFTFAEEDLGSSSILTSDVNNNTKTKHFDYNTTDESKTSSQSLNTQAQDKDDKKYLKEMRDEIKHGEIKAMKKEAKPKHK